MKAFLFAIPLMFAFMVSSAQCAEKPADNKPDAPAGKEGSWSGALASSQGAGLATLKLKEEKKDLVLWATDETIKTEIATLAKKHANANVSGMIAPDNINVQVTSISEIAKEKKKGK